MKRPSKKLVFRLILLLVIGGLFLHWRQTVAFSKEELLALACKEARIPKTDTVTLLADYDGLLCLAASSHPDSMTRFYVVSFRPLWWTGWGNAHSYKLAQKGPDLYVDVIHNIFFSDNPQNAFIRIKARHAPQSDALMIPVTEYPFCYWLETGEGSAFSDGLTYDFLDRNGKSLIP